MDTRQQPLHAAYESLKSVARRDCSSLIVANAIHHLVTLSLHFLESECSPVELISLVPGKQYIAYARADQPNILSRPANRSFFNLDSTYIATHWQAWLDGNID